MPYVRGHFRRGNLFRSHWVSGHTRRRPGTNALTIVAVVLGVLVLLWLLEQIL